MKDKVVPGLVAAWLTACAPQVVTTGDAAKDLLSGYELFGEVIDVSDIGTDNILALNDEMREYVDAKVGGDPQARSRLRKLIQGMIDDGLLTLDYDPNLTYTAIETFQNRQGNCLSFSILFAALAREADLDLTFQMVDIPPSFRADGDVILLNNHINVRVKRIRRDINFAGDYVVDFNTAEYSGNYDTMEVEDSYAIALYFSNVAVEAMQQGQLENAFRYLKKGIETDPGVAGLWVNLGVLYSRNENYSMAIDAYRQALSIQPSNKSALANLAGTLQHTGRTEEARYYSDRVTYYRNRNPYYHYHLAQEAYQEDRLDDAMTHLDDAIGLKNDEHQFYFLRGLIYEKRKNYELAARNYEKARDTAEKAELVSGYTERLQALESSRR
jgi:tetratricopeptide (TPR) repeat protein